MKTITHTPGPWIKDGNKVYGPKDPRSKHKNGRMFVAEVPSESSRSSPHCDNGCSDQQAELDARLIAAAPELLVALEATRNFPWVHNAGITNDIEALRRICLAYADWANSTRATLLAKVKGLPDPNASAGAKR